MDWTTVITWWVVGYPSVLCLYVMVAASIQVISRERSKAEGSGASLSVAVLVPARNEAAVIEECIRSLLASHHPRVIVHVISDGSSDATAEIARSHSSERLIVHEHLLNLGKSRALESALALVTEDLVMVVDADTRLAPGAIPRLADAFADERVAGATANIRVKGAESLLAKMQMVEFASIIGLLKRANSVWGGLFTVSGAACCFRTSVVRSMGGFASPSITEDIELSWRLQTAGHRLVYVPGAVAHVEVPDRLPGLWKQRRRWSQGMTEVLRLHGAVWRSATPSLMVFAVECLLSMLWAVALTATLITSVIFPLFDGKPGYALPMPEFWHYFSAGLFAAQTAMAMLYDNHYAPIPWRFFPLCLLYPIYFVIVILPSSLLGWPAGLFSSNTSTWERSERHS